MAGKQKFQVSTLVKKANEAVIRRNYDLAIYSYLQALRLDIVNNEVRLALRAVQAKNSQIKGTSGFGCFLALVKANLYKVLKKYDEAILVIERGLTANPRDMRLLQLLIDTAQTGGYLEIAIWQRQLIADSIAPRDTGNMQELARLYKKDGQPNEAIKILEKIKTIDSGADVDGQMRELSAQMSSRIFEKAAKEGSRSIMKETDDAEKIELEPSKLRSDEQRRAAIQWRLEHDLTERPKDGLMWAIVGDIATSLSDFQAGYTEAMGYYDKAKEVMPENASLLDRIGELEMRRLAVEIAPVDERAKAGDATAKDELKKLKRAEFEYQLAEYKRRVIDQPLRADYHNKLGTLYMRTRNYDDAIGELQIAAKDPKWRVPSLTLLGRCMLEQKNIDMAISQFERAREGLELFDKFKDPMYYEASAYLMKAQNGDGDKNAAQKALDLFTQLYENDIKFRDVKDKVQEARNLVNGLAG